MLRLSNVGLFVLVATAFVAAIGVGGPCIVAAQPSDVELAAPSPYEPIQFGADEAFRWEQGSYEVWVLRGRCFVQQGARATESREAVLWVKRAAQFEAEDNLVIAYLEGDVRIIDGSGDKPTEVRDAKWYGEFNSAITAFASPTICTFG